MLLVDDRLAYRSIAGLLPGEIGGWPIATTYGFHYRLVRALASTAVAGALSRHAHHDIALDQVISPSPDRLVVLDPRRSLGPAVGVAARHGVNLLLAELVGAAKAAGIPVRVTTAGVRWNEVMAAEGIDFAVIDG